MENAVKQILEHFKVNIQDPNFVGTPLRFKKAMEEILCSSGAEPPLLTSFPAINGSGDIIFNAGLKGVSLCPHHLFPYMMEANFAYIAGDSVVGVSKPGRLLRWLCGRMALQEVVGPAFLEIFNKALNPLGSMIMIKGVHLCNTIRGAKQDSSSTITVASTGIFRFEADKRNEFYKLAQGGFLQP